MKKQNKQINYSNCSNKYKKICYELHTEGGVVSAPVNQGGVASLSDGTNEGS